MGKADRAKRTKTPAKENLFKFAMGHNCGYNCKKCELYIDAGGCSVVQVALDLRENDITNPGQLKEAAIHMLREIELDELERGLLT